MHTHVHLRLYQNTHRPSNISARTRPHPKHQPYLEKIILSFLLFPPAPVPVRTFVTPPPTGPISPLCPSCSFGAFPLVLCLTESGVFPPSPSPPPPPPPPFFRSRFFSLPCALSLSRVLFFSDDPPRRRDTPLSPSRRLCSAFSIESLQLSPPPSSPSPSSSSDPAPPSPLASSSELA